MEKNYLASLHSLSTSLSRDLSIHNAIVLNILSILLHRKNYNDLLHNPPNKYKLDFSRFGVIKQERPNINIDLFEMKLLENLELPPYLSEKLELSGSLEIFEKISQQIEKSEFRSAYNLTNYPLYGISFRYDKIFPMSRAINNRHEVEVKMTPCIWLEITSIDFSNHISDNKAIEAVNSLLLNYEKITGAFPILFSGISLSRFLSRLINQDRMVLFNPWNLFVTSTTIFTSAGNTVSISNTHCINCYKYLSDDPLCTRLKIGLGDPDDYLYKYL
jgi:hypothetical protein